MEVNLNPFTSSKIGIYRDDIDENVSVLSQPHKLTFYFKRDIIANQQIYTKRILKCKMLIAGYMVVSMLSIGKIQKIRNINDK